MKLTMSNIISTVLVVLMTAMCRPVAPEPTPTPEPTPVPTPVKIVPAILEVSLPEYPTAVTSIDDKASTVSLTLPYGSKLGPSVIEFKLTDKTVSNPASGSKVDLSSAFNVFLTAEDGSARKYRVNSSVAPSNRTSFKWMTVSGYLVKGVKQGTSISFALPYGTDLKNLKIEVPSDNVLSFDPDITVKADLSAPVKVKVCAEDGITFDEYTLSATVYPKDKGIRGIYLPSPSHTASFITYENLCKSMDLLKELNFNCIFVGAWDASRTAWPSEVLLKNSTYTSVEQGNMYSKYTGGSGDAVADMISEGHKRGIKVVLWYEYGFMHKVGGVNLNDPVLARHPDWIGIGSDGKYCNYNGTDFYLNAYNPEVRKFMLDLILESVRRYPDLDGVQGDDRLPAMPANSGYDEATKALYFQQTGKQAPTNYAESNWFSWRLAILNRFAVEFHDAVKAVRPGCWVCFAPNKYPWAEGTLMQCWPQWVKDGAVDLLTVQSYVVPNYENDVKSQVDLMKQTSSKFVYQPAMILKNGAAILTPQLISDQLSYNRKVGTLCESQFWFDGLWEPEVQAIFKLFYSYPADFPEL